MPLPLALQLYSLREDAAEDFPLVLRKVAAMGYAGVEYAGLHGHDPAAVGKLVNDLGMVSASAHMPLADAGNVNEIVDTAQALGMSYVVGGGGPPDVASADTIKALADRFNAAADLLAPHGIRLGTHNHWWEFDHQVDGKCPHDVFMALAPSIFAQVDVYWARFGGDDPVKVIERNAGRVDLLHIKDGTLEKTDEGRPATPHTAVGAGKIDTPAVVAAGEACGAQWLIVELDNCATNMEEAVRQSAAYMLENGLALSSAGCGGCGKCCGR